MIKWVSGAPRESGIWPYIVNYMEHSTSLAAISSLGGEESIYNNLFSLTFLCGIGVVSKQK